MTRDGRRRRGRRGLRIAVHSGDLAGTGGFEPPHGGIKIRCLTAWRRPNARRNLVTSFQADKPSRDSFLRKIQEKSRGGARSDLRRRAGASWRALAGDGGASRTWPKEQPLKRRRAKFRSWGASAAHSRAAVFSRAQAAGHGGEGRRGASMRRPAEPSGVDRAKLAARGRFLHDAPQGEPPRNRRAASFLELLDKTLLRAVQTPDISRRQARRSIAQPGRALLSGSRGRVFESRYSDHPLLAQTPFMGVSSFSSP